VARIIDICIRYTKPVVVICGINKIEEVKLSDAYDKIKIIDLTKKFGITASLQ